MDLPLQEQALTLSKASMTHWLQQPPYQAYRLRLAHLRDKASHTLQKLDPNKQSTEMARLQGQIQAYDLLLRPWEQEIEDLHRLLKGE